MTTVVAVAGDGGKDRGPLSGRTPLEVVGSAQMRGLPMELANAVLSVTGKTRLWNRERVDVARELCGHFFDGLEEGAMPGELLASFGDPRRAAKLITRAKKRNRPWSWRAMVRTTQVVGALVALVVVWYGWNAARFYLGSPTIRFNVQAEMNEKSLAVPLAERGWPKYRDAYRGMKKSGYFDAVYAIEGWPSLKAGAPGWDTACKLQDKAEKEIDLLRAATRAPRMAYVLRSDIGDMAKNLGAPDGDTAAEGENPVAVGVLLPQLSVLRSNARVLGFEVRRAAAEGRGADVVENVERLLGLAHHGAEDGTLIAQLVELAVVHLTVRTVSEVVRDHPSSLSDAQLQRIAHSLAGYSTGPDGARPWTPELRYEQRVFDDLLQRFYTDDGNGDGRLCKGVMAYHREFGVKPPKAEPYVQPIIAGVVAGRAEMRETRDRLMHHFEAEIAKPLHARDQDSIDAEVEALKGQLGVRNSLVVLCSPPSLRSVRTFDETRMVLNGVVAGVAAELYTRRHGQAPAAWSDLVPAYLPAAPVDPWSGKELGFKAGAASGGRPLIYSVGADMVDDGGVVGREGDPSRVQQALRAGTARPTWDWVIWPAADGAVVQPMGAVKTGTPKKHVYRWGWLGPLRDPVGGMG